MRSPSASRLLFVGGALFASAAFAQTALWRESKRSDGDDEEESGGAAAATASGGVWNVVMLCVAMALSMMAVVASTMEQHQRSERDASWRKEHAARVRQLERIVARMKAERDAASRAAAAASRAAAAAAAAAAAVAVAQHDVPAEPSAAAMAAAAAAVVVASPVADPLASAPDASAAAASSEPAASQPVPVPALESVLAELDSQHDARKYAEARVVADSKLAPLVDAALQAAGQSAGAWSEMVLLDTAALSGGVSRSASASIVNAATRAASRLRAADASLASHAVWRAARMNAMSAMQTSVSAVKELCVRRGYALAAAAQEAEPRSGPACKW
jgi:hypothetical protein